MRLLLGCLLLLTAISCSDSPPPVEKPSLIATIEDFEAMKKAEKLHQIKPECRKYIYPNGTFSYSHPLTQCESSGKGKVDTNCKAILLTEICKWKWDKKACMEVEVASYENQAICRELFNGTGVLHSETYKEWLAQLPDDLRQAEEKRVAEEKMFKEAIEQRVKEREKNPKSYLDIVKEKLGITKEQK